MMHMLICKLKLTWANVLLEKRRSHGNGVQVENRGLEESFVVSWK